MFRPKMLRPEMFIAAAAAVALAGCATTGTTGNGALGVTTDGGYYVAADNGNGDYYYDQPQVVNDYAPWQFSVGFGSGWYGPGFGPWGWYGPGYGYWGWYGPGWWWYGPPPGYWHHHHHAIPASFAAATCCQRDAFAARPVQPVQMQMRGVQRPASAWREPPERRPMRMEMREPRHDFPRPRPHEPR